MTVYRGGEFIYLLGRWAFAPEEGGNLIWRQRPSLDLSFFACDEVDPLWDKYWLEMIWKIYRKKREKKKCHELFFRFNGETNNFREFLEIFKSHVMKKSNPELISAEFSIAFNIDRNILCTKNFRQIIYGVFCIYINRHNGF